jgi:seryl-tRNA synthetase
MAEEDKKPNEPAAGDQPAKDVVSYAKYKRETEELKADLEAARTELKNRDAQIGDITKKAGDAEALQKALDDAKSANDKYKTDAEAKESAMKRDFAVDSALRDMGARNIKAARALIDQDALGKAEVKEGKVSGIDFDAIKTANPYLFADKERFGTGGDPKGSAGGADKAMADFRAQFGLDKDKE